MEKALLYILLFTCFTASVRAQKLQPLPPALEALRAVDIFPGNAHEGYVFIDRNKDVKPSTFSVAQQNNGGMLFTAEVGEAAFSHFNVQAQWKSTAPVKRGDVLLARLNIR